MKRDPFLTRCGLFSDSDSFWTLWSLVHHNAATQNAAMHNASFSQRYPYPLFLQRHRCDALPCFSASPVVIFTSHTSPFGLCFHFSFHHNGLLYKTTRNLPRVTTQRCRHWQREMAIANANANAAMRCTKLWSPRAAEPQQTLS